MNKQYTFLITILLIILSICINAQETFKDKKGNIHLLGSVDLAHLSNEIYKDWYQKGVEEYHPNINKMALSDLHKIQVKVFIGTWCGDTKNYLPKFIKLWKEAGLSESQLDIVALHRNGDEYKRSPERTEETYNIHRVPTFIFEKDGIEIGRIVERPVNDLVTDLTQIATGYPSKCRYQAVSILHDYFLSQPKDSLYSNLRPTLNKINRNISGPGELNGYGYLLMAAKRYTEAELAFRTNVRLFPYNPNNRDSLGEFYMEIGKYQEAKDCFDHVLDIKNEDKRATEMLTIIEGRLNN